jgi:hypothetical protein
MGGGWRQKGVRLTSGGRSSADGGGRKGRWLLWDDLHGRGDVRSASRYEDGGGIEPVR